VADLLNRLKTALSDRYAVERELGAGGMATVYLATDLKHERKVAVKLLRPELAAVIGAERFLAEIKTTANLQHPHILPLHDSGEAEGFLFYVMPFVEGESLRVRLDREKQLPVEDAVRLAREVASALDYAHRHDVIHRDIKPENVLIHDGQALVADFGIALAVSQAGGTRMTETGLSLGTPHYMSPEQAMGERDITAKTDVYALGCVLYEMLTGEPPFTGPTAQAIVAKVMSSEPEPITTLRKTVPPHVEASVNAALQKLPADRPATAAEFEQALEGRLPPTSARDVPSAPATGPSTWTRRSLANWHVLVGLFVVLGVGFGIGAALTRRAPPPSSPVGWFEIDAQPGTSILGHSIDLAADGERLVYIGRTSGGGSVLFRRELGDPVAVPITGSGGGDLGYPFVEPSGERVGFYQDRQLRMVPMAGGASRTIASISGSGRGAGWTSDGRVVYHEGPGSGLQIVDAEGGSPARLTVLDTTSGEVDHRWPQVLPGNQWVVFTIWKGAVSRAEVGVASIETGTVRSLVPGVSPRYVSPGYLVYGSAEGVLRAVRFDLRSGTVHSTPVTVLDSILIDSDGSVEYTVSWNGTLAYHNFFRQLVPVVVDRDGRESLVSTPPLAPPVSPRLAPNGAAFAVGDQSVRDQPGLWVYDLRVATYAPLVDGDGFYPLWTPDSRTIIYSRNEGADVRVYAAPADRSQEQSLVVDQPGQHRTQDLSPDGRYMLLRKSLGTRYELWVLDRDSGDAPTPWLSTDYLERAPTFSPNGRWIAYSSDESGRDEVYVRPFPGPGGRIQVSTEGGIEPAWHPNGRELFFRSGTGLLAVGVQSGESFRIVGPATTVIEGPYYSYGWQRQYDVYPDGNRFLLLKPKDEEARLNVVVNWIAGWRDRDGEN
jgi:serine/threonine-protein kinase